ncbi:MAG: hypothetical protein LBJ75_01535 [Puniceicoccales bacterium]|nr:hypothetical protein [Puniceicoccales bacterium]
MSFFGNFGGGFGRPSWSPLGGNMGNFGGGGMIVGGNMGPFGSGIDHGSLPHVTQPSLASTLLDTNPGMHVISSAATTLETIFPRAGVILPNRYAIVHGGSLRGNFHAITGEGSGGEAVAFGSFDGDEARGCRCPGSNGGTSDGKV